MMLSPFLTTLSSNTAGAFSALHPHAKIAVFWLIFINIAAFLLFGADKAKARRAEKHPSIRRIPERILFLLAGLGGSPGALLGMYFWHHKTQKSTFRSGLPAILGIHLLLVAIFLLS